MAGRRLWRQSKNAFTSLMSGFAAQNACCWDLIHVELLDSPTPVGGTPSTFVFVIKDLLRVVCELHLAFPGSLRKLPGVGNELISRGAARCGVSCGPGLRDGRDVSCGYHLESRVGGRD